jgi:glucan biosynthesis protein C
MQTPVGGKRIYALDALRAFLMFFGLLVHAGSHTSVVVGMNLIALVSGLFRMEGFFVLAVFFAAMILAKVGARPFHGRRLQAILLPFLIVLPTNLIAIALQEVYLQRRAAFFPTIAVGELQMPWHLHLWFLLVLGAYTILTVPMQKTVDAACAFAAPLRLPSHLVALGIAVGGVLFARLLINAALGGDATLDDRLYPIVAFGNYIPFYLIGILAYRSESLRAALVSRDWRDVAVWSTVGAAAATLRFTVELAPAVMLAAEAALSLAIFSLLCAAFQRLIRGPTPAVAFLADAAYTVYLLHYLVMWMVFAVFAGTIQSYWTLYALALVTAPVVTLMFHAGVVRRSPLLSFLLNGKRRDPGAIRGRTVPAPAQVSG